MQVGLNGDSGKYNTAENENVGGHRFSTALHMSIVLFVSSTFGRTAKYNLIMLAFFADLVSHNFNTRYGEYIYIYIYICNHVLISIVSI